MLGSKNPVILRLAQPAELVGLNIVPRVNRDPWPTAGIDSRFGTVFAIAGNETQRKQRRNEKLHVISIKTAGLAVIVSKPPIADVPRETSGIDGSYRVAIISGLSASLPMGRLKGASWPRSTPAANA